jgi:nitroimidazol reductase NimA-like FMN-containing flavoprotein (pyridoxamine 5'-phosphate oxidase superfamily)
MPALGKEEIESFLSEPGHMLRLATLDADGMPRNVPIWYVYDEGMIKFTPRANSVFLANLLRDPRCAMTIDEDPLPYRKVALQGPAQLLFPTGRDDEWRDLYRAIAKRYIDDEAADAYVDNTIDQPRALLGLPVFGAGTKRVTWRMPVGDEDPTGIWHRRYYLEGTKFAQLADDSK